MTKIKEKYDKLKKEYNLPNFEALDKEFEISSIDEKEYGFLLRAVRKKIVEKIEFFAKILEDLLNPETNLTHMHETKEFNEDEKQKIYDSYRKLMLLHRTAISLALDNDNKTESEFINQAIESWNELKKELIFVIERLKKSWKEETDIKEDLGYLG